MRLYHYLLLLLPFLAFTGCDDDIPQQGQPGSVEENDDFVGDAKSFQLGVETSGLSSSNITCKILAPDGNIISRQGTHFRNGEISDFTLGSGLKDGTYRLLYVEYPTADNSELAHLADRFPTSQYGLGCRITVVGKSITVCDDFDEGIGLAGSGTKDDPYIISSYSHLMKLMKYVNSDETNKDITPSTYFQQTNPIDMEQASFECDVRYGWLPIGADTNTPFRGVYYGDEISYLWIDRPSSPGMGLFGYVYNATIDNLRMSHADIKGNFAVGSVAGAAIAGGDDHGKTTFTNCSVSKSSIAGSSQSFCVGGLIGAVDMYSLALVQKCESTESNISGSYNVGGIVGGCGRYSSLSVGDCTNSSKVTGEYSGVGGIVGVADTLYVAGCTNEAAVNGAIKYSASDTGNSGIGAGGICGGSGLSWLSACVNSGEVNGAYGVGGIIGSTRIKGGDNDAYMYNNTLVRWCKNTGNVSGRSCVGGMCGEAQFGSYGVYNSGNISGGDYTAGIVGITSIAVAHNAVNTGTVTGGSYCAGIVGKASWGSIALDHNYGKVNGSGSHTAGVMGLAGNNTIVHYCGNFGAVTGSGSGPVAGLIAEIGDPRVWTAMNIAECVVGSLEIVMAFAGPTIAVAEHAVEAISKGAAIALKVVEISADVILTATDAGFAVYGLTELLGTEAESELQASLHDVSDGICDDVKREIARVRSGFSEFSTDVFDKTCITSTYNNNLSATLDYYEVDGNDEIFNENINKRREERMEELEKAHKTSEIIHEVIAGVSIAVSTVAIIGGAIASGGAAVPFIVAGSAAALVGGANAISKSTMDFAENAVVISQCVNAGTVSGSSGNEAGLVGILQDNSIVTDCLNAGKAKYPLSYQPKSKSIIQYCLDISPDGHNMIEHGEDHYREIVCYSPSSVFDDRAADYYSKTDIMLLSAQDIGKSSSYDRSGKIPLYNTEWSIHWDMGNSGKWYLGSGGKVFPVPNYSEMRE